MKHISVLLVVLLIATLFVFSGCGGNADGDMVVELLTEISRGNWDVSFDLTHPAMVFCGPDKESFVAQMPHYGVELEEFFKGAEFTITGIIHEDEWSSEGIPFTDVSRVSVSMVTPTPRKAPKDNLIAKSFEQTGIAEILVSPDPFDEELKRKVVFSYGTMTNAYIVQYSIENDEYSSPYPNQKVSDPEPGVTSEPANLEFFDIFDEGYQKKYMACVLEIQNTKSVLALTHEGKVLFFRPIDPPPDPSTWDIARIMWESFGGVSPESISSFLPPEPKELSFGATATEMREKVAQALKLFVIMKEGYGIYKERFPNGILALSGGTQIFWPDMITTTGDKLVNLDFTGENVAFIYVSSCGSCMNRAAEVRNEFVKYGMPEKNIIMISRSPKDKLGEFEKRIGSSHLVIDLSLEFVSALGLFGTPSMTVIDGNANVIVSLDSHDTKDTSSFNRALSTIFGR